MSEPIALESIVVDDQQAAVIARAGDRVIVRDRNGQQLAYLIPSETTRAAPQFTPAEVEEIRRRLSIDRPRRPHAEVMQRLRTLYPPTGSAEMP